MVINPDAAGVQAVWMLEGSGGQMCATLAVAALAVTLRASAGPGAGVVGWEGDALAAKAVETLAASAQRARRRGCPRRPGIGL